MNDFKGQKSPEEVIARLRKLIRIMDAQFVKIKNDSGMTHSQFRIIFPIVHVQKGYAIQELSEITGVDKGFVSRTIAKLEKKGIVKRDRKSDKERNYPIILTDNGWKIINEVSKPHKEELEKWLVNVSRDDIHTFIKVLFEVTKE